MIRRMLLAVDESESSLHALRQALPLVRSEEAEAVAATVVPPYQGDLRLYGETRLLEALRAPYEQAVRQAQEAAQALGLPLKTRLEEGDPAETVLNLAEAGDFDLVVTSRKGRNILDRLPIGSVSAKLVRLAREDVLIIPGDAALRLHSILLAHDGSAHAELAARRAIALARAYGARLILATVHELPVEGYAYWPEVFERLQEDGQRKLEALAVRARSEGARRVETVFRLGRPADELCRLAEEEAVGLTVMGSKGMSGLARLLLGSVAEQVIACGRTPVWIVKKDLES